MNICKYCGKQCKNKNSLVQHEIRCKENQNRISIQSGFIKYNKYRKENGIKGENQYTKAKRLNLDKPKISEKVKEKFCKYWLNKKLPDDMKNNIFVNPFVLTYLLPKFSIHQDIHFYNSNLL